MHRLLNTLSNNLLLKLTALGLAFLLWFSVKTDNQMRIDGIPVEVSNGDPDWVVAGEPDPPQVGVVFSGPYRELIRMAVERPSVVVPVAEVRDSTQIVALRPNWVTLGNGLTSTRVEDIRPAAVRLTFDRVVTREIPVVMPVIGMPVPGFELAGPVRLDPPAVRATGASRILEKLDTLRLPALDLTRRNATDTVTIPVEAPDPDVTLLTPEVRAIIRIRPVRTEPDTMTPLFLPRLPR